MFEALELCPGVKWEPLFKTEKEYQEFRERYIAAVTPQLEAYELARRRSEQESFFRRIG